MLYRAQHIRLRLVLAAQQEQETVEQMPQMAVTEELHPLEHSHLPTAEKVEGQVLIMDVEVTEALVAVKVMMDVFILLRAEGARHMAAEAVDVTG